MTPQAWALLIGASIVGPILTFVVAWRRLSGKISTTSADELWAESRDIRLDYRKQVTDCRHELATAREELADERNATAKLRNDIAESRNETADARAEIARLKTQIAELGESRE